MKRFAGCALPMVSFDQTPLHVRELFAADLAKLPNMELSEAQLGAEGQALIGGASQRGQVRGWFAASMLPN